METKDIQGFIGEKYSILEQKGFGYTSLVFKVQDNTTKAIYACKVYVNVEKSFYTEKEILHDLTHNPETQPYIANLIDEGEDNIIARGLEEGKYKYIVLEYLPKGSLDDYIKYPDEPFSELHAKFIFSKILDAVEACHKAGKCHRDLKLDNILINENPILKLCDFGFATNNNNLLRGGVGDCRYCAPEMFRNEKYDGNKADIYSLGIILFALNTNLFLFDDSRINNEFYFQIYLASDYPQYIQTFWEKVKEKYPTMKASKELKELYIKMISFYPKDRPDFKEISESEYMKEITYMPKEQKCKLEVEVKEKFRNKELEIMNLKFIKLLIQKDFSEVMNNINICNNPQKKAINIDKKELFDKNIKPEEAKIGINMENFIILNGKMNPGIFMEELINEIKNEYKDNCMIPSLEDNKLEFKIIIDNKKENEIDYDSLPDDIKKILKNKGKENFDDIEDNDNIKGKNKIIMQINLFITKNEEYLLRFVKKEGDKIDYLDNIKKIISLVEKIIK